MLFKLASILLYLKVTGVYQGVVNEEIQGSGHTGLRINDQSRF